jgi:hypothetical protein
MTNYFDFVDRLAKAGDNRTFFNSGPMHASIVMSRIFKYAKSEVLIFCGGFSGEVSSDSLYLKNLEYFLNKENTKLKVAVEVYSKNEHSKLHALLRNFLTKVEFYETDSRIINTEKGSRIHFTVADKKMLRIETDVENFTAQVNFNSPDGEKFGKIFEDIISSNEKTRKIDLLN